MSTAKSHAVEGPVSRGFEGVRAAFAENFARRHELGGACCAFHRGRKVVDLWAGVRNRETGEAWEEDTMVIVYSATKGLSAMTLALPIREAGWTTRSRSARIGRVRAERQGTDHRSPAPRPSGRAVRIDEPVDRGVVADLDRLAGGVGSTEAGVGARDAPGVPRLDPRVLRGRAAAASRPAASEPRAVLPGRDRYAARTRRLHPPAGRDRGLASRRRSLPRGVGRFSASRCGCARGDESALDIYRALVVNPGSAVAPTSGGSTRATWKCRRAAAWDGAGDRARLRRVRGWWTRAGPASGHPRSVEGAGDPADPRLPRRVLENDPEFRWAS